MMQKLIEERLNASEAEIEAIKKEVQRIPVLEKTMERMHAMLTEMYEDRQRQPGGSELTGVSTGKRKIRTEDLVEGDEEGETSLEFRNRGMARSIPTSSNQSINLQNMASRNGGQRENNFRRWTNSELQAQRDKGLCYRCDEPFSKGHRCKNKEFRLCVVADDLEDIEMEDSTHEGEMVEVSSVVELSLNSVVGLTAPGTFKVKGTVDDREIVIMVDCGAIHNFISLKLVESLNLPMAETTNYAVWKSGASGLQKQGAMTVDWKALTMTFVVGDTKVILKGDPSLTRMEISLKVLVKTWQPYDQGFLINFRAMGISKADRELVVTDSVEDFQPEFEQLQQEFSDIFDMPDRLPPMRQIDHRIQLKEGTDPINVRPYRYPHAQKNEIERLVNDKLASGIIRPSTSLFSSSVILVKKKDGGWRFCVDYRALNRATVPDKFPIPMIDELLDELNGASIFSKIDLKSGYHQIRVRDEDVRKTTFRTHEGHYEFLVMPFGLTNAPTTFQALMNQVFRPYLRKFLLVFFDDILVYSKGVEAHLEYLIVVFQLLRQHCLFANQKKCYFAKDRIEYLGHWVSAKGVEADQEKIKAMLEWPTPKNVREFGGFLGLTGYYHRFVVKYGAIATPLMKLTKKNNFCWLEEATKAFEQLKRAMVALSVLALPNFQLPFEVETNASGFDLGAVLSQNRRPIAYFSQKLSSTAREKSVYERELMAIVLAVEKWRHYLLGHHFVVYTDQKALRHILERREIILGVQKWLMKLVGFDFEIRYRAGPENKAADALSPLCWTLQGRLVLSKTSSFIPTILHTFHDSIIGGHSGQLRTYKRIAAELFWEGMKNDIKQYVDQCHVCRQNKVQALSPARLLQPLPIPNHIWEDISMDFVEGLPCSKGFDTILVVVDRISKYAHFITLGHPFSAKIVAMVFIKEVVRLHGYPCSIVSDRDRVFLSHFWKELFRCFCQEKQKTWSDKVAWAEYWYNTKYQSSITSTPYAVVYGQLPPPIISYGHNGTTPNDSVEHQLQSRNEMLAALKRHLQHAQERMKKFVDVHRRDVVFDIGDRVYLKLQPYRQQSVAKKRCEKLSPRYFGPYTVLGRVGEVSYLLDLPETVKIHPVFHVSQLKKAVGDKHQVYPDVAMINDQMELMLEPENVTQLRWNEAVRDWEYLVQWKDQPSHEATWESALQYPGVPKSPCPQGGMKETVGSLSTRTPRLLHFRVILSTSPAIHLLPILDSNGCPILFPAIVVTQIQL
ncbi:Ty3/gypsy retrotransposon protein [Cucumis melo var. makuwa]|uniref:Ty3/gypsy retrotransposon protein n=1 Tax=Cucumis melo var. makuwa TaxID=1194695 RepID=A0A5A7V5G0_CUCMM|nr:Ty3/gypsy retrotransposon protein [Cucumis melo var. makuwa]TYK27412.1 Ty3/gypsy retrotransposon protein [Cucumis melo var. makuwa]